MLYINCTSINKTKQKRYEKYQYFYTKKVGDLPNGYSLSANRKREMLPNIALITKHSYWSSLFENMGEEKILIYTIIFHKTGFCCYIILVRHKKIVITFIVVTSLAHMLIRNILSNLKLQRIFKFVATDFYFR